MRAVHLLEFTVTAGTLEAVRAQINATLAKYDVGHVGLWSITTDATVLAASFGGETSLWEVSVRAKRLEE